MNLSISLALCLKLFPMVMCLTPAGEIRFISERLQRRMPTLVPGTHLHEAFVVASPAPYVMDIRTLNDTHLDTLFLLHAVDRSFALRGQLTLGMFEQEYCYIFVGSPWSSWLYENFQDPVLLAEEFPIQDSQLEHQMYLATQNIMRQDLEELSSKLKRSKVQAEAANRAKTRFVRHISHEIRTPLNGVITALRLVQDEADPAQHARLLEIAENSCNALMDLVNEVLDFSRIEEGAQATELVDFNLRKFLSDIEAAFSARAAEKHMQMRVQIDPGLSHWINTDRKSLQKVLYNLIGNAIKYSRSPQLWVRAWAENRLEDTTFQLHMEVEDHGIGIAVEDHDLVFQPFWAAGTQGTEHSTGLGLAITRELITHLGGNIGFDSTPGKGTRFHFHVPARSVVSDVSAAHAARRAADAELRYSGQVLLVDDNAVNLELGKLLLEKIGFTVITAENGEGAIRSEHARDFDLIFMDINMPGIDGMQAAMAIRATGRNPKVPIVALTANVSSDDVQLYRDSGMNDVLTKPIVKADLARICDTWLIPRTEPAREPATAVPAETALPLLAVDQLNTLISDIGVDNWTKVLFLFLGESERRFEDLIQALDRGDAEAIRREAHRLASSVLAFGLTRLGTTLRDIEKAAVAGQCPPTGAGTGLQLLYRDSMAALQEASRA